MKAEDNSFRPARAFWELDKARRLFSVMEPIREVGTPNRGLFIHRSGKRPFSENDTFPPKSYELMWGYLEGSEAVGHYHKEVESSITRSHAEIESEVEEWNHQDGFECSSYKLSLRMKEYVQAVWRLGYMAGGTLRAFQLALHLGKSTYTQLPSMFGGYNYRPVDPLIDGLLVEMAKLFKKDDPRFDPKQVISELKADIAYLEERGIYTHFPQSYKLLCSYLPGSKAAAKASKTEFIA